MRTFFKILLILLAVIIVCACVFLLIYRTRIRTVSTITKLSDYEDGYNLYTIDIKFDYDPASLEKSGFTDMASFSGAVCKDVLPLLPIKIETPSFGCSAYRAHTADGENLMGRNYDFRLNTSCLVVRCAPKDGYRSVAFAALSNLSVDDPLASIKNRLACLAAPYLCLDGVNEKGVSIAVLTLDSEPVAQNTGKDRTTTGIIIRQVLDHAATTQEAIALFEKCDMIALNGRDYHYFLTDASGDSCVIEYDCDDPERKMVVTKMDAITNFFAAYVDTVLPNQKNGIYGHGKERYDAMMSFLEEKNFTVTKEEAWEPLVAASQEPNPESITSNTQWSIVFNNTECSADITLRRHWDDRFSFSVGADQ